MILFDLPSAGGVVVNPGGDIAIVNQNNDSWSFPKGHIERSEDALAAALREIEEETGIPREELHLVDLLGSYDRSTLALGGRFLPTGTQMKNITMFLFTTDHGGPLSPTDPDNPEARWVHPAEVADLLTHPQDKEFFTALGPLDAILSASIRRPVSSTIHSIAQNS